MLRKLLRLVAEGGVRTRADLSRELGVSEGLRSRCWRIWPR